MSSNVVTEKKEHVLIIRLNRSDIMNSLERDLVADLKAALRNFDHDNETRAAILTGQGKAFCAGGSLSTMKDFKDVNDSMQYMNECNEIIELINGTNKPVIAAVNGAAVGAGFNMAIACDMVIASSNAFFAQSFLKVGLVPDMSGLFYLPRVVGVLRAKELVYTGRSVKADEALQMGVANIVVTPEALEHTAFDMACRLARGPSVAFLLGKRILSTSLDGNLKDVIQQETYAQTICLQTEDYKEGLLAFFEKRSPVFKGK